MTMIKLSKKQECCGCTACASVCGRHSIVMEEDDEGFKYPHVNIDTCVNCGLCEKVCPMLHPESDYDILKVIGAKHRNTAIRKESSSGGVFSLLAEYFIEKGGIVAGCVLDEHLQATHVLAETKEELYKFRSSKYVQSNIDGIFRQIRSLLRQGRQVLFSGTPCQVAGLRRFLLKKYDNLSCIDILCHGVPSPKMYHDYLHSMEEKYGSKASFISFRSKKKEWKRLYINILFHNGKEYFKYSGFDAYMQLFLGNKSQRSSCFHCPFTSTHRQGDISLGDFWGIGKKNPDLDDDKGISMILVNSQKGKDLIESIQKRMDTFTSDIDMAVAGNKVLCHPIRGEAGRDTFYQSYVTHGFKIAIGQHTKSVPLWQQYYYKLMRIGLDLLRKIMHKGY